MRWLRWVPLLLIVALAGVFAYLNGGERITLHLGLVALYRVSLTVVVFSSFVLGMISMYLLGLRHDMRIRRTLREHGLLDTHPSDD